MYIDYVNLCTFFFILHNFYTDAYGGTGGYPKNLVINSGGTIDISGLTGGEIYVTVGGRSTFTTGYQPGMEAFIHYDGYDQQGQADADGKFTAVSDGNGGTELALTYHLTVREKDGDLEFSELSGDYIAGIPFSTIFCDYDQDTGYSLKAEVLQLLVKDPDATYHYEYLQLLDEQNVPYDFAQGDSLDKNTVIQVEFRATEHDWSAWANQDDETHFHTCDTCAYRADEAHDWGAWSPDQDGLHHTRSCQTEGCGATQRSEHTWGTWTSDDDNTHSRSCTDGCGATQRSEHTWGAWTSDDDSTHSRSCTDGCGATQQSEHTWGAWTSDDDSTHSRSCTDGCGATQQSEHTWGTWSEQDEANHVHTCSDCQATATEAHDWGTWSPDQDGLHHTRSCQTEGCGATQQSEHTWGAWTPDDESTHSRSCTDGCGATQQSEHTWGAWTSDDESTHSRSCTDGCGATQQSEHTWGTWTSDDENTHSRSCTDGCGATQQNEHTWGAWTSDDDSTHSRSCTDGCGATQQSEHTWGVWTSDDESTHSRSCTDGCGATQQSEHNWGAWREQDEANHVHTCSDCQATATEAHDWGVWQDDEDGEHHTRSCETCPAEQTRSHAWVEWYETDGETWTRDCDDCAAREVKADPRHVAAALLQDGKYRPYYTLQSAFDDAVSGQTVCIVFYEEGVALDATLVIGKSVLLGAVTRTVGEDRRASYAETSRALTFKRADGFTGTMISIARGANIRFDNLILQGGEESAPAVEVYGSLTVAGGSIDAACSIRVRSGGAQGISLLALGDAALSLSGSPALGTVLLDDPAGGIVPCVDLSGYAGTLTLVIGETRPYGAFARNIGTNASVTVVGGERRREGLSCREVRLQDGMYLCGGYDLTVEQTALGEVTIFGECDEYLPSLAVTVNGTEISLTAGGGNFVAQTVETQASVDVEISVGGETRRLGLVAYDPVTGMLNAPDNSYYLKEGQRLPLGGADPFALSLAGDDGTVEVEGESRTFDFSRPVGTAFVYRYLTEDGVLFAAVDHTNYERIQAGAIVYETMTERQQGVVDERLAATFGSFAELLAAVNDYLAAQSRKVEDFLHENDTVTKEFGSITSEDSTALEEALAEYEKSTDEERHFLDEEAEKEGYSDFAGMLDDLLAKTQFEAERERTLENLVTILRGCDGVEVRRELSLAIETVEGAVYDRCTDDDLRLEYLAGQKGSLETAVRVLENIRSEERVKSAFDAYLTEKRQSGCYSDGALGEMSALVEDFREALAGIDPEDVESGARIEELLSGGMEQLDAVCADYVVSGGGTPAEALSDDRAGRTSELHGYLKRENGFRGESKLSLLLFRAESPTHSDLVVLFGVKVELTGAEQIGNAQVALLLPAEARGYMGYRVIAKDGNGEMLSASAEGNVLLFDTDGGAEFLVLAQKQVDLVWLVVLLSCLCGLETAALCYVVWYLIGSRTASFAPLLAVAVIPASAVTVCAVLGAVCVGEGIALILLLRTILRREKKRAVS